MKYTSYSSKIILIGDAEQLPSVAAGNVLFELLKSKAVPVVRLSAVYRQGQQSLIVTNCELIKHNSSELRYGEDFSFIPTGNQAETANTIISIYQSALTVGGQTLDDIQVLCPFKKKDTKPVLMNSISCCKLLLIHHPHQKGKSKEVLLFLEWEIRLCRLKITMIFPTEQRTATLATVCTTEIVDI